MRKGVDQARFPIFITGLSGLLGSNLARYCAAAGFEVSGVSHRRRSSVPGVREIAADITAPRYTPALQPGISGCLVHCAAATDVDWCEQNEAEAFQLNVQASRRLAAAAKRSGWRFVYISTDSVFDGRRGNYGESDVPQPLNAYARSKLAGEQAAVGEAPDTLIIRTNFYGLGGGKLGLAGWVMERLSAGAPINGFDDVVFNPLFVGDLCRLFLELAGTGETGVFHLGSTDRCSKYEFAIRIAQAFRLNASLVARSALGLLPRTAQRPLNTSLNISKTMRTLGRDLPTIEQGLQKFREVAAQHRTPV